MKRVDARGLLCPWPALRLARAARELGGAGRIEILADDPVAPRELRLLCEERGWQFRAVSDEERLFEVIIG